MTVTPTAEGLKLLGDAPSPLQDRFRSEFFKLREWEQTQMLATLQRIAAMMDATELDAAPLLTTGATVTTPVPPESVEESEEQAIAAGRQTVGANDDSKG